VEKNISNMDKAKLAKLLLSKGRENLEKRKDIVEDPFVDIKTDPEGRYEPFPLCSGQETHLMGKSGLFDMTSGSNCYQSFIFKNAGVEFIDRIDFAFQRLIERHDALRIKLISITEQQVMKEVPKFYCNRIDLRHLEEEEAETKVQEIHRELVSKRSNPFKWPLFEVAVLILKNNTLVLCMRMDLFTYDFPSRLVITDELFKILKDRDIELPDLHFSFRDFVMASTIEAPKSLFYKKSKEYWTKQMAIFPSEPKLPKIKSVLPGTITPKSAFLSRLGAEEWNKIKTIANEMSLTPAIVASTAFSYVLSKFSKSPDFFIGLISFNRFDMHKQVDEVLGCFVQVVPLFFNFEATTFADYCKKSRKQLIDAIQNRYYPGHMVLRDLHKLRKSGSHSLCPVMLTLLFEHKAKMDKFPDEAVIGDITSEISFQQLSLPQLQLHPGMGENPDGSFWCYWNHATGIYAEGLIEDMSKCLSEVLSSLSSSEDNWTKLSLEDLTKGIFESKETFKNLGELFENSVKDEIEYNILEVGGNEELKAELKQLIKEKFNLEISSDKEDLYDLGFDSLMLLKLVHFIGERLEITVPEDILIGNLSIESIAEKLDTVKEAIALR
jgi:nonribosomal peptide synthetase protein BlmIV